MKLFSIGDTEIRCSPLLLAAIPLAIAFRLTGELAVAFLSLTVHEAAHAMAARSLGCPVASIEIQPFGFVARLDPRELPPADAAAVFAAGPAASLCMAAGSALMENLVPMYAKADLGVMEFNLLLAAVNLLPALPLDGGRLVAAAFSGRAPRFVSRLLRAAGVLTGAAFLALFALLMLRGAVNPTFLFMGAFLMIAALRERDPVPGAACRRPLGRRSAYPVRTLAVSADLTISRVMALLPADGYTLINVVDGGMRRLGVIDERQLVDAACTLGSGATLRETVALLAEKML